jgi:CheY-like chemotaxis protein
MPTRTILLVEDDPNDEQLTLRALRQSGVPNSAVVAHNGREALDFLTRNGPFDGRTSPDPSAIFLDNTLPGYPGPELIARIRSMAEFRSVPIIVLSGASDGCVLDRCSRAGANSFLEKPVDMTDYLHLVSNAVRYWLELNLGPNQLAPQVEVR